MSYDTNTLEIRKPLWIALSDLFLDTALQDYNYLHIAKAMKESGYSLDEIEVILMSEVFPTCATNLDCVAGEWVGFNEDWVCNTIISGKPPSRFRRWLNSRSFWMIKDDWQKVVEAYKQL